jgi:hypothetical protein
MLNRGYADFREIFRLLKNSLVPVCDLRFSPKNAGLGPLEPIYAPINVLGSSFSTGCLVPTASLMRNDLLDTARRMAIEERKGYRCTQNTPKGTQ